ncbi:hypothetical protein QAD02_003816 [Eretmocerus hayati]|uniref:Uncharacterized protein n=1 Tax=Eretmocerus hayati TaxID=131215 RepID=A0ACC2NN72_9HYME|nr:hypothetical protein QAD02_003816 [Eretmocerus hayati]
MVKKLIAILLVPVICFGIHLLYLIKVDPLQYTCVQQKRVNGDPVDVFEFIRGPLAFEKLLPWLTRFKEADKRIVGVGKSYRAVVNLPIFGERHIHAFLSDYRPPKVLALEFTDDFIGQEIIIQTLDYHGKTLLKVTVIFERNSVLFQKLEVGVTQAFAPSVFSYLVEIGIHINDSHSKCTNSLSYKATTYDNTKN